VRRPCCAERQARSSKGFAGRIGIAPTSASQRVEAADIVKDFRCASGACALLTAAAAEATVTVEVVAAVPPGPPALAARARRAGSPV